MYLGMPTLLELNTLEEQAALCLPEEIDGLPIMSLYVLPQFAT